MFMNYLKFYISAFIVVFFVSCEDEEYCDCQEEGIQIFQLITDDDVDIMNSVEGVDVNECIRYDLENIFSDQIDYETVKVVDMCCCQ